MRRKQQKYTCAQWRLLQILISQTQAKGLLKCPLKQNLWFQL
jgi:hypothetical protein